MKRQYAVLAGMIILALVMVMGVQTALAQEKCREDKPARGLVASLAYTNLTISPDDKIRVDIKVKNTGRSNETVNFEVLEKPDGWKTQIKSYSDVIGGLFLSEGEDRNLTLAAFREKEEDKLPKGEYKFTVKASTPDGALSQTSSVTVVVADKEKASQGMKINTSYPFLKGPSDSKFEFSLDINNDSDEDALFNLSAVAPEGWEASFKPAYEEKQISSLQIKANQSGSVNFQVTPPVKAEAGQYEFIVRVQSAKEKAEASVKVQLTGTYTIKTGTPSGLLSLATQKGQTGNISLFVKNEGSAPQREVTFLSFKPENWKVEFKPEKLQDVKAGEVKQVEVVITPSDDALVGDYSVAVNAQGEKSSDEVEFRITVRASSAWGWIGVGLIVLVMIFLAVMFKTLGRR